MSAIGESIIRGMRDFSERLEACGGDVNRTGLRTTRYEQCARCGGSGNDPQPAQFGLTACRCRICGGSGTLRIVTEAVPFLESTP